MLQSPKLIVERDLNLVMKRCEVWGDNSRMGTLAPFSSSLFEEENLVDVEHVPIRSTWMNDKNGKVGIAKRLDHFLVAEQLLEDFGLFCTWIGEKLCSDHQPF